MTKKIAVLSEFVLTSIFKQDNEFRLQFIETYIPMTEKNQKKIVHHILQFTSNCLNNCKLQTT